MSSKERVSVFGDINFICVYVLAGSKLNVFLTDLSNFPTVNEVMADYFAEPYPARAAIGVAALPKASEVEMDAVMIIE